MGIAKMKLNTAIDSSGLSFHCLRTGQTNDIFSVLYVDRLIHP